MTRRMIRAIGLLSSVLLVPAYAGAQSDHCNALLSHGINNVSRIKSANHAASYNYHKYCRKDISQMSDSSVRQAQVSIFGFGSGGGASSSQITRTELESWCERNEAKYVNSNDLFYEARTVNESALAAWNSCQDAALKHVVIRLTNNAAENEFMHFTVDSTADSDVHLVSVLQKGYKCHISHINEDGNRLSIERQSTGSDEYENVVRSQDIPAISNANIHVDCQRLPPSFSAVDGVATVKYASGSVVINTTGPAFAIDIPAEVSEYYYTPPKAVVAFAASSCPVGWSEYEPAYGRFVRGIDRSGKIDPDGELQYGDLREDTIRSHAHLVGPLEGGKSVEGNGDKDRINYDDGPPWANRTVRLTATTCEECGNETRPKSVSLLYCVKN